MFTPFYRLFRKDSALGAEGAANVRRSILSHIGGRKAALPNKDSIPLYFGSWSGMRIFRSLKPFSLSRVR